MNPDMLLKALTHLSMAFFVKNEAGVYLAMNAAGAEMIGGTPEQILGHDDHLFFSKEATELMGCRDRLIMQAPRARSFESVVSLRKSPEPVYFQSVKRGLTDATGHRAGILGLSIEGRIENPYVRELVYFMQELMDRHPQRLMKLLKNVPKVPELNELISASAQP